tara:strand:+ start:20 stop:388 length:369 start_codon:yes stop_codon:yes gene_type:complete
MKNNKAKPVNNGRILPCCQEEYLIKIASDQLTDDGFFVMESTSTEYSIFGQKFMAVPLGAEYRYIIIKIGDSKLTRAELEFSAYVNSLPKTGPIIINCIVSRVPVDIINESMTDNKPMNQVP